jgi:hypothetical protein
LKWMVPNTKWRQGTESGTPDMVLRGSLVPLLSLSRQLFN